MRVDKYLWCVRLFKTRSLATKACASEKVRLNEEIIKPSKELKRGDIILLKEPPIWRTFKVLDIPKTRVGAKLVADLMLETTSEGDLIELQTVRRMNAESRSFGIVGRPTKRHRRDLDDFKEG
ncbi:MAG: S4 domain-containing protein [Cryomorphaceae bacterium]